MHYMPQTYSVILITLLCFSTTPGQAETNITGGESDRQQLRSMLQELDQAAKQRQQQNRQLEVLSQRLECNWALIRAWETCGQLHERGPGEHLQCSMLAKQNAERCLEEAGEKK